MNPVREVARILARQHASAPRSSQIGHQGSRDALLKRWDDNVGQIMQAGLLADDIYCLDDGPELAGLSPLDSAPSAYGTGIYTSAWTERCYAELLRRARMLLCHGESVVADASWISASLEPWPAATTIDTAQGPTGAGYVVGLSQALEVIPDSWAGARLARCPAGHAPWLGVPRLCPGTRQGHGGVRGADSAAGPGRVRRLQRAGRHRAG